MCIAAKVFNPPWHCSQRDGVTGMKVVGIVGSPRQEGNTETLTRIALEEIAKEGLETELISLAEKKIEACDGCRGARANDRAGINILERGLRTLKRRCPQGRRGHQHHQKLRASTSLVVERDQRLGKARV